jgi:hypothetical protein
MRSTLTVASKSADSSTSAYMPSPAVAEERRALIPDCQLAEQRSRAVPAGRVARSKSRWLDDVQSVYPNENIPFWMLSNHFYKEMTPVLQAADVVDRHVALGPFH